MFRPAELPEHFEVRRLHLLVDDDRNVPKTWPVEAHEHLEQLLDDPMRVVVGVHADEGESLFERRLAAAVVMLEHRQRCSIGRKHDRVEIEPDGVTLELIGLVVHENALVDDEEVRLARDDDVGKDGEEDASGGAIDRRSRVLTKELRL